MVVCQYLWVRAGFKRSYKMALWPGCLLEKLQNKTGCGIQPKEPGIDSMN
jgi:hypothetical protein